MTTITGETQLVGVIGYPVKHSLSPQMHNAAFEALGLNWRYVPLAVRPDRLPEAVRGLAAAGFRGVNLTVPHKVDVLPLLDSITDVARLIDAANTISFEAETGALHGTNTDLDGFMRDLDANGVPITHESKVILLGAGGAARAISVGLLQAGAEVVIVNRSVDRAAELVALLTHNLHGAKVQAVSFDQLARVSEGAALIVNATPLGMWPHVDASSWAEDVPFPAGAVVYDTVYRPARTKLLRDADAAGLRAIGGIGMLVRQGAAAFELWTNHGAPVDVMMAACLKALRE
ncbi:MAG: shikimate dehydrogenase [Anaerolineae bacterium]